MVPAGLSATGKTYLSRTPCLRLPRRTGPDTRAIPKQVIG